jgi:hypothetical protein
MTEPAFDIFSANPNEDPLWLETAVGLSNARERMEWIAAKKPGRYFIFSLLSGEPVAQIETFGKAATA